VGSTCWLADRHEDVNAAAAAIEARGRQVGRVLPLDGETGGVPNCLHPDVIKLWQAKHYDYRAGFCGMACDRRGDAEACPFLMSIKELAEANTIAATKALARRPGFFSALGNKHRRTVVLDEDPIDLLRPLVEITREELEAYLEALKKVDAALEANRETEALTQSRLSRQAADWCWKQIAAQPPGSEPAAVEVPDTLQPSKAVLKRTKRAHKKGRRALYKAFHRLMRRDPESTVRNVCRDLLDRAAAGVVFVTSGKVFFHLVVRIPAKKQVIVLDATANPELLRPIFAPRPVEVLCDGRVSPAGRVIQLMDFNGPRSYLNKLPRKLVRIIDAIGDRHPAGIIVLISHRSCVGALAKKSRHAGRIKTAYFGALRGRNDLEPAPDNPIACHIVAGSPKTTEEARRQLALAVYGRSVLPFPELVTVRRAVVGHIPVELAEGSAEAKVWEVRCKGYAEPRMQAVYDHTVTAELTHAADRARVLIHRDATVYLVTNEPCPRLWFAEMCFAGDFLDLSRAPRSDFESAYQGYAAKAKELLDAGQAVGNADVCRAMGQRPCRGWRYWQRFLMDNGDALEGVRKVRWKGD
jgi:hypothetical protein